MIKSFRNAHRIALAFLACTIATCALLTTDAAYAQDGRPVTLAQANAPATFLSNLGPGAYITTADTDGYSCVHGARHGYFSEVSAYTWRGGALTGQHWDAARDIDVWRDHAGRAVTFDGITFRNHTHHVVIVAGWCE